MRPKVTLPLVPVCLLLLMQTMSAQQAPYIKVTDTDGIEHDLYEDYIRKGRSVMLSIFFSSCAPCQLIGEDLQQLYEEWGEGNHDVEFLQVSSEDWETNETAESYRMSLGLTFPIASAEGGSLEAVDSLVNGGFGAFFGAPLYTVIGPDSLLQWNIFGFGNEETITELDQALLSTGAEKPVSNVTNATGIPQAIKIMPNPAIDDVTIHVRQNGSGSWDIRSVYGHTVHSGLIYSSGATRVSVADLPPGQYVVSVKMNGSIHSQHLVKI